MPEDDLDLLVFLPPPEITGAHTVAKFLGSAGH